jgi:site-specific DNA-methyltransferase (adenine-specific)
LSDAKDALKITHSSPETGALTVPIGSIIIEPGRGRKQFNGTMAMAESLKKHGFINPILCHKLEPGKCPVCKSVCSHRYSLLAGERRYRGAVMAGLSEVKITFRENLSQAELKIIELEENVQRQDLAWDEECELHKQIHESLTTARPDWSQHKTAEFLNLSDGHVSMQISMAKKLKADPSLRDKVKHMPMRAAAKVIERAEEADKCTRLAATGQIAITTDLRLGSCVDLIKQVDTHSVDMVLCDPPYGLEKLEDMRENGSSGAMSGHATMSEHHNMKIDDVLALLRKMGPELSRVMRPGAAAFIFCGAQYIGDFIKALAPLEFQPPLLVWDRGKSTSPFYGYNFMGRTEYIIHLYNPPGRRRLLESQWNILEHPEVPRSIRRYPTEKPVSLLSQLIKQASNMGELVLDFTAGSASTLVAARQLGRRSLGFEINPESWQRAQLYLAGNGTEPSLLPDEQPKQLRKTAKFEVGGTGA